MAERTLREAGNTVRIFGSVKEKNIEIKKNKNGGNYIGGYLVIQTVDGSAHRVNVFANETTKDGKPSGAFKALNTVKETYISLADCATNKWDVSRATNTAVTGGKLGLNEYYGEDGNLHSSWSISANFFDSSNKNNLPSKATFEVEGFIASVREKEDKVFLDLIVPQYGGRIAPITFSTTDVAGTYLQDNYKRGDSGTFRGEIVSIANKVVVRKEGFGEVTEDVTFNYVRALVINAGDPEAFDPDGDKAWSAKDIKLALAERETYLETLKTKVKTPSANVASSKSNDEDFF